LSQGPEVSFKVFLYFGVKNEALLAFFHKTNFINCTKSSE